MPRSAGSVISDECNIETPRLMTGSVSVTDIVAFIPITPETEHHTTSVQLSNVTEQKQTVVYHSNSEEKKEMLAKPVIPRVLHVSADAKTIEALNSIIHVMGGNEFMSKLADILLALMKHANTHTMMSNKEKLEWVLRVIEIFLDSMRTSSSSSSGYKLDDIKHLIVPIINTYHMLDSGQQHITPKTKRFSCF